MHQLFFIDDAEQSTLCDIIIEVLIKTGSIFRWNYEKPSVGKFDPFQTSFEEVTLGARFKLFSQDHVSSIFLKELSIHLLIQIKITIL